MALSLSNLLRPLAVALCLCIAPALSFPQTLSVGVSIHVGPPVLPVYVQPPCPMPGYLWTPGYWAYGPVGYYWVPGVWVAPPRPGLLWTPGYWGLVGGVYSWHAGYWAPHVGFYGGINYGFGYAGTGFVGGIWAGNVFRYNTAVVNVNTTVIHNTYVDRTVVHNVSVNNHVSFNGPGGIAAQPSAQERIAMREPHVGATANQLSHQRAASQDRRQWASTNGGHPGIAAMNSVHENSLHEQSRGAGGHGVAAGRSEPREASRAPERGPGPRAQGHERREAPRERR